MVKIEYSKDLENAKIANIGIGIDGKKIVRLYEHSNEENYEVGYVTQGDETVDKLMKGRPCLAELIFYHNESIDSLIKVLQDLKNASFINEKEDLETYKKCKEILGEENKLVLHAEKQETTNQKLEWVQILVLIGKPLWDAQKKKWRILNGYKSVLGNQNNQMFFEVTFTDSPYWENFFEKQLYMDIPKEQKVNTEDGNK